MLVLIDNRDSFTYNLVQGFGVLGARMAVYRSDAVEMEELESVGPSGIVISPGPGRPQQAGAAQAIVRRFAGKVPIFGVGLGYLCIAEAFGARVVTAEQPLHGRACRVVHRSSPLYQGVPSPFTATCYYSLVVDPESVGSELEVTAVTEKGEILGVRHKEYDVEGVHFHPESILTEWGPVILANFLRRTGVEPRKVS